jgi:hypothetical protein
LVFVCIDAISSRDSARSDAAFEGFVEPCKFLVNERKLNPHPVDKGKKFPLHYACQQVGVRPFSACAPCFRRCRRR